MKYIVILFIGFALGWYVRDINFLNRDLCEQEEQEVKELSVDSPKKKENLCSVKGASLSACEDVRLFFSEQYKPALKKIGLESGDHLLESSFENVHLRRRLVSLLRDIER